MTAASEIMRLASAQLQDVEAVRWTRPELLDWLNEGLKAIVLAKPSAKSGARTLTLAKGSLQRIEAAADLPTPSQSSISRGTSWTKTNRPRVDGRCAW